MSRRDLLIIIAIVVGCIAISIPIALVFDASTHDKGERISELEDRVSVIEQRLGIKNER